MVDKNKAKAMAEFGLIATDMVDKAIDYASDVTDCDGSNNGRDNYLSMVMDAFEQGYEKALLQENDCVELSKYDEMYLEKMKSKDVPVKGGRYKHVNGEVYRVVTIALDLDNTSLVVICHRDRHIAHLVWPLVTWKETVVCQV